LAADVGGGNFSAELLVEALNWQSKIVVVGFR
jgi:hypothetical protein